MHRLASKTKKINSVSPRYELTPRMTQVQHILIIDIIFMKKVTFLLWVITPLGLGIVEFLRDRSVDSVETEVRTMLVKTASRSFDVLEIRCDGEIAVGALAAALEQRGIACLHCSTRSTRECGRAYGSNREEPA